MLGTTPSFFMNFLIQTTFYAVSKADMYSASILDATVVAFFGTLSRNRTKNTKSLCYLESSLSDWKLASQYPSIRRSSLP